MVENAGQLGLLHAEETREGVCLYALPSPAVTCVLYIFR